MAKKQIYTITIISFPTDKPNIWYANKVGQTFKATLVIKELDDKIVPVYLLSEAPFYHVYEDDCEVKKTETIYTY
jgi:hypothetical protein